MKFPDSLILSRTDNLGDVVLTLPMAGFIKKYSPQTTIYFLGKSYTKAIATSCPDIDVFLNYDELKEASEQEKIAFFRRTNAKAIVHVFPNRLVARLAKKANISLRIGTAHRWFHWWYANRLLFFSRRQSDLHESQLNLKLLSPFGDFHLPSLEEMHHYVRLCPQKQSLPFQLNPNKFNLVLHPKSKGSAREWGLENFSKLIAALPPEKYDIYVTGSKEEGVLLKNFLQEHANRIIDLCGKLSLEAFVYFLGNVNAIVAASTGPLHIAAVQGVKAIGLYAPMRPIFPQRWSPIGTNVKVFVKNTSCEACRKSGNCMCIKSISFKDVLQELAASS
ncbi:MAG: glycosyltransferase family 9 protein [Flammeovirgaceae bacterium]|nr:glycosyltransferase family 9 protein [Flammeovirgaceae bacterium]MDW8286493.1 glycosyltransferase family 9 protein [Flammeovirgaceae bacterium]